ncbi:MAG: hypothetical protein EG824_01400 [Deltaproteobacteria bacterium]|nr:hypothetical protein [Deltaproteobacteria bacterium]
MKLHSDTRSGLFAVTAYDKGYVQVGSRKFARSLLLMPENIDPTWGPEPTEALAAGHLAPLAALAVDVLLLGTGSRQHFPRPELLRPLIEAGRSIEVMDTGAACRTYNILVAEGRTVAAALIVE